MSQLCAYTPQDTRNLKIFNGWAIGAGLAFMGTTLLVTKGLIERGALAWVLATVVTLLALMMVRSYMVFLRHADELLRKIQLEGLALGFGAGTVFMLSYRLYERLGAPRLDIDDTLLVMIVFWALGQYLGYRRYQGGGEEQ